MNIDDVTPKKYRRISDYIHPRKFSELAIGDTFKLKEEQSTIWKKIDMYRGEDTSNSVNGGDRSTFTGYTVFVAE